MVAGRPPHSFCTGPMPYDCGSSDPAPPKHEGYLPAFVNNLVSPFMSCWQPPINSCVSPSRRSPARAGNPPIVSPQPPKSQLTKNIREPHSNDVLCGRGGSSNRHVGNLNFRSLVAANKDMYVTLTKKQKMMVARKIVEAIHSQEPPGRFLQKDSVTGLWYDIGIPRSLEKTSQALREKIAPPNSQKQLFATPVSPGGSSVTAITSNTEDAFSDKGAQTPMLKSPPMSPTPGTPPGTLSSSPVPSTSKPAVPANEIPLISIPAHLESQFRPRRRMESRRPVPPPRYDYHYPHPPPHHHPYALHGPPPPQPYLHPYPPPEHHHDYYHRGPPPPHFPYPPPMPMDPRDARSRGAPYPSRYSSSTSSKHHVPPSPDRRDYRHHELQKHPPSPQHQPSSPHRHPSSPHRHPQHVPSSKGRQTTEVSPGRRQAWKKQRVQSKELMDDASLTRDMESQLSLRDSGKQDLKSPSAVLQSRSRRSMAPAAIALTSTYTSASSVVSQSSASSARSSQHGADALAGLAALSSAALLKLNEDEK